MTIMGHYIVNSAAHNAGDAQAYGIVACVALGVLVVLWRWGTRNR